MCNGFQRICANPFFDPMTKSISQVIPDLNSKMVDNSICFLS